MVPNRPRIVRYLVNVLIVPKETKHALNMSIGGQNQKMTLVQSSPIGLLHELSGIHPEHGSRTLLIILSRILTDILIEDQRFKPKSLPNRACNDVNERLENEQKKLEMADYIYISF